VHVPVLIVVQELGASRVHTQLLQRVVDDAEFFLAVIVVGAYDPPSLRVTELVEDDRSDLRLLAA